MIKHLIGIDVSHHNSKMKDLRAINDLDFVIMKASEGKSYRDRSLPVWLAHMDDDMLKGFYHFCRADNGNTPVEEADNFLGWIEYALDGSALIALDVEGAALKVRNIDRWCYEWCKYVYEKTGIKPLIYTSESYCYLFKKCAEFGCGLWCAKWGKTHPKKIKPFDFTAIWQYSSNSIFSGVRVDMDQFNGSREQFLKYCEDLRNEGEDTNDRGDRESV